MGTVARGGTDAASGGGHCANCASPYVTSQALNNSIVHPTFCLYKTKLRLQHTKWISMAITYYSSYSRTKMIINVHNPGYAFWLSPVSRQNEDLNLKIILQHLVQMLGWKLKLYRDSIK